MLEDDKPDDEKMGDDVLPHFSAPATEKPGVNDTACAALRGYINIGLCADAWTALHDPVYGIQRTQAPFAIKHARQQSLPCEESWTATVSRLEDLEAFLRTLNPPHLADADGASQYLPTGDAVLTRGKIVFAENCARCHSSKQPPPNYTGSTTAWFTAAVQQDDFLAGNFLSDDQKYPVSEIGTNAGRALATNAERGHIWQEFSSESYKNAPPVRLTGLADPLHPSRQLHPVTATGGTGYYRTPSLLNIWATAPFFHNNALGLYNADPSIAGRLAAYQDAMTKLLWPERRPNSIPRTTQASRFYFDDGKTVCIPPNTPVDLIGNVQLPPWANHSRPKLLDNLLCKVSASGALNPLFLHLDNAPDFIEDRGHLYGATLPDPDKQALIEYMKLF